MRILRYSIEKFLNGVVHFHNAFPEPSRFPCPAYEDSVDRNTTCYYCQSYSNNLNKVAMVSINQVMVGTYMRLLEYRHNHQKPTGQEKHHWENNIDLRNGEELEQDMI